MGYGLEAIDETFLTVIKEVRDLAAKYGKPFQIGETGWPSQGKAVNALIPSNKPSGEAQNVGNHLMEDEDEEPNTYSSISFSLRSQYYFNVLVCKLYAEKIPMFYFQAFDLSWDKNGDPGTEPLPPFTY